jgi:hypothetical protein
MNCCRTPAGVLEFLLFRLGLGRGAGAAAAILETLLHFFTLLG